MAGSSKGIVLSLDIPKTEADWSKEIGKIVRKLNTQLKNDDSKKIIIGLNIEKTSEGINKDIGKVIRNAKKITSEDSNRLIFKVNTKETSNQITKDIKKIAKNASKVSKTRDNGLIFTTNKAETLKNLKKDLKDSAKKAGESVSGKVTFGTKKQNSSGGGNSRKGSEVVNTSGIKPPPGATGLFEDPKQVRALTQLQARTASFNNRITTSFRNGGGSLMREFEEFRQALNSPEAIDNVQSLEDRYNMLNARITDAGALTKSFGDQLRSSLSSSVFAGMAKMMITTTVLGSFSKMIENVKRIDKQFTELRKVSSATMGELYSYMDRTSTKAGELGVNISELVSATADFARLGYQLKDAESLGEIATKFYQVGDDFEDISQSTQVIVSALAAQFDNLKQLPTGKGAQTLVDEMNEVSNNYSISAGGLAEAMTRSAASLAQAGATSSQAWGIITGSNAAVQDPDTVGTMLKTMTLRLRAAKAQLEEEGLDTEGMITSTSKLREEIKALTGGFDIMQNDTTFKPIYEQLSGIAKAMNEMDSNSTNTTALLELLTGKRGATIGLSMLKNWDMVEAATESAENSAGSADKEYNRWLESVEGHISVVDSKFQDFSQTVINSSLIKGVMDLAGGFLDISKALGGITPLLAVFGTFMLNTKKWGATVRQDLSGKKSLGFSLFGIDTKQLKRMEDEINQMTGDMSGWTPERIGIHDVGGSFSKGTDPNTPFSRLKNAESALAKFKVQDLNIAPDQTPDLSILTENQKKNYSSLLGQVNTTKSAYDELKNSIAGTNEAGRKYLDNMNANKGALTDLTKQTRKAWLENLKFSAVSTVLNFGLSMLIGTIFSLAVEGITKYINRSQDALKATQDNVDEYKNLLKNIEEAKKIGFDSTGEETDEMKKFFRIREQLKNSGDDEINVDTDDLKEYYSIGNKIAELMPEFVSGWDDNNNAIIEGINNISEYRKALEETEKVANKKLIFNDTKDGESQSQVSLEGGDFDDSYEDYKAAEVLRKVLPGGDWYDDYINFYKTTSDYKSASSEYIKPYSPYNNSGNIVDYLKQKGYSAGVDSGIYGAGDFNDVLNKAIEGSIGKENQSAVTDYEYIKERIESIKKAIAENEAASNNSKTSDFDKTVEKPDKDLLATLEDQLAAYEKQLPDVQSKLKLNQDSYKAEADEIAKNRAVVLQAKRKEDTDYYADFNDSAIKLIDKFYSSITSDFFVGDDGKVLSSFEQEQKAQEVENKLNELVNNSVYKNFKGINKKTSTASSYKGLEESLFEEIKNMSDDPRVQKGLALSVGLNVEIGEDGKAKLNNKLQTIKAEIESGLKGKGIGDGVVQSLSNSLGNLSQEDIEGFESIPEDIFDEMAVWIENQPPNADLAQAFSSYISSAIKAAQISNSAKQNIAEQIKSISSYTDVAGAILKEQSDNGGVSSDSVVKLYDAFKDLDGFDISNFVEETTDGFVLVENASTYLKDIIISNKKDELKTLQDHAIKFLNIQDIEATGTEEATNRIIASYQNRLDLLLSSGLNTNEKKLEAIQLKKIINDLEGKTKDTSKTKSLIDKLLNEAQNGNAKDKILSQWEKFYAELKHKRQMDLISEEEYYRQLNKGMNMYLTGNDDNTVKQKRQVQEELHDYEIKAWDRALQKQQRSLDTGKITNTQYYRWITRNADKYLAKVKGNSDKEAEIRKALYDAQKTLDDQYYDKKNKQQDSVLKAVDSLFDDEIKNLNKTKDSIKKAYDQEIDAINDKIEVMDEENNQRQRALDLAKAEEELAKAQRNRSRRVYKAGVGFVYEQDQSAIADAQNGLSDVRVNNAKSELEDEKKALQKQSDAATQYYSDMIDSLEEYKSAWDDVPKEFEKATNQMVLSTILGIHNLTEVLKGGTSVLKEFQSLYDNTHIGELIKNLKYGDETYSMSDINYIEALAKQMNVDTTGIKTSGVTAQQSLTNAMSILAGGNKIPSSIQMSFGDIVISSPVGDGKSLADAIKSQFPNYMTQLMSRNY